MGLPLTVCLHQLLFPSLPLHGNATQTARRPPRHRSPATPLGTPNWDVEAVLSIDHQRYQTGRRPAARQNVSRSGNHPALHISGTSNPGVWGIGIHRWGYGMYGYGVREP
ncbi:hypothetical protein FN846DRAFT_886714 [Sphaerosporella brunnea]|uniref:Secreted protein n=1 Tax=Sphaerosporella brunnea TaxID=1250544 RepID=A0A5J5F845_9PEZI|nr:hypothetical protein FN846DRAFT_886714 [Sphaerosporella brunnea]